MQNFPETLFRGIMCSNMYAFMVHYIEAFPLDKFVLSGKFGSEKQPEGWWLIFD